MYTRSDRIRKALIKEISDIIQRHVKDPRISGIVSVTDVEVSADYKYAKTYVSVFGTEEQKEQTLEALQDSTPYIRSEIGKRVRLRYTPEIEFIRDDSLERGSRITELIDKISRGEL
ncbi:MAG: ribosome-binding factor A [Candidatus Melainabacteria bacterium GWF2_32_7]|nr:MAG: ribosome-binding factor A [Candidatus Melainabacteria bacterium GWF2_32_7]OGI22057.1 MAG: ribosome-binding factor A [Candidatus Melainabacteria bacterium RIFOXYA2_FULL_32_9]